MLSSTCPRIWTRTRLSGSSCARRRDHPDERWRHREITRLHEEIHRIAPKVTDHRLALEDHVNARGAATIEVALAVGLRAGRAEAHAAEHDEATMELARELAVMGLHLPKRKRLQAMVEVLALDLVDDDTDGF